MIGMRESFETQPKLEGAEKSRGGPANSLIIKAGGLMNLGQHLSLKKNLPVLLAAFFAYIPFLSTRAAQRTISSLPYTVTSSDNYDTLSLASSFMTTSGRALTFGNGVHDIYFDFEADTLEWGTSGDLNTYGLWFAGGDVHDITIDGGFILHNPPPGTTDPSVILRARAVRIDNSYNILFKDTYFSIYGRNSQIFYSEGGCYNIELDNCVFYDGMESFTQRDMWIDNAMLALGNNNTAAYPGFQYHFKIHGCTTENAHWCNLYLHGDALVADVHDNYFISDARNDYDVQGPIYGTAAQCYAVSVRGGDGGSRVKLYNNTIRSGTSYAGGRGIFVSGIDGISLDPDSSIYIYNNDIQVHQGFDGEEHTLNGIIVRQSWKNIYLRENNITCIGDTISSTQSYEQGPICGIRLTTGGDGNERGLKIVGNVVRTYFTGGFTPDYGDTGPYAAGIIFDEFSMNVPNVVIDSNMFESSSLCIRWGFYNGHGGNVTMRDNIYSHYNSQGDYVFYLGYGAGSSHHAYNNRIINGIFLNGAQDTSMLVWDGEPDSLSISLMKTMRSHIQGNNGLPVPGADVRFVNAYGEVVGQGSTNGNGIYSNDVSYWWEGNDTFNQGDSTLFNDFLIVARKNGDSTSINYHLSWDSPTPTLVLSNTPGEEGQDDQTPPGTIVDLDCVPGNSHGQIEMTWTATGDDGDIGTASYYVIKYSIDPIDQYNFAMANTVANPPSPLPSGQTQNFTISGLGHGEVYYVAMKAYDEIGNGSTISNVQNSFAAGIMIPDPLGTEIDPDTMNVELTVLQVESYLSISYEFELDTLITFPSPLTDFGLLADTVASVIFTDLSDEYTYHWRCRAIAANSVDSSDWTTPISFNVVTGVGELPSQSDCIYPIMGQIIDTENPVFQVRYIEGLPYIYFRVDDNAQFTAPVESGPVLTVSGQLTAWQYPSNIIAGMLYYWQISADNQLWTSPISFSAVLDIHPYPNPFRSSDGFPGIIFTNLSVDSDITIVTSSGEIVFEINSVGPGEWTWNLRNRDGHEIASGVYLYHVDFPNGTAAGKLMVIR